MDTPKSFPMNFIGARNEQTDVFQNEFVYMSGSHVRFAHDSASKQMTKLVIRNRYAQSLFLSLQDSLTTTIFHAYLEKVS